MSVDPAFQQLQNLLRRPSAAPAEPGGGGFDPADHTVDNVKLHVEQHPDERGQVLQAEVSGKNRSTLVAWLEGDDE